MEDSADKELRAVVAAALDRLNRDRGGRYLGRIADAVGVHRSSVSRWASAEAAPSFERCLALADRFPAYFDRNALTELQTRAALGQPTSDRSVAVVREVGPDLAAVVESLLAAMDQEPSIAADREILHVALDPEYEPPAEWPGLERNADLDARMQLRSMLERRARDGWKVRVVVNASEPFRIESTEMLATHLEGPDVEVRVYPLAMPLVISMFVVARRHVFLAYDVGRTGLPIMSMLHLESPAVLAWATRYFESLFNDAPLRIRTSRGVSTSEMALMRQRPVDRSAT